MQTTELRPLGAGEMLDRAITLFVRRFGPIVAVLAVVIVPVTVVEAFVDPRSGFMLLDVAKWMSTVGDPVAARHAAETLAREDRTSAAAYVFIAIATVVRLLMWTALLRFVAGAYTGRREGVGDAYRFAVRRWLPQLLVALAFAILAGIAAVPVLILYIIMVVVVVGLVVMRATIPAIIAGTIGGLVVLAALLLFESIAFTIFELAAVAVVTETANPVEALSLAIRRALAPGMKRRSVVAGIVVALVSEIGMLPVIGLAVMLTAVTHVGALYFAVFGAGTVLIEGLIASFVVVFAFDARVRREGYDLFADAAVPAT